MLHQVLGWGEPRKEGARQKLPSSGDCHSHQVAEGGRAWLCPRTQDTRTPLQQGHLADPRSPASTGTPNSFSTPLLSTFTPHRVLMQRALANLAPGRGFCKGFCAAESGGGGAAVPSSERPLGGSGTPPASGDAAPKKCPQEGGVSLPGSLVWKLWSKSPPEQPPELIFGCWEAPRLGIAPAAGARFVQKGPKGAPALCQLCHEKN